LAPAGLPPSWSGAKPKPRSSTPRSSAIASGSYGICFKTSTGISDKFANAASFVKNQEAPRRAFPAQVFIDAGVPPDSLAQALKYD
jgi:hypothetical protein